MQATANTPQWQEPRSLAEVNSMLQDAGLPGIGPAQLERARAQGERTMLVKALNLAPTNENARRYLIRVLELEGQNRQNEGAQAGAGNLQRITQDSAGAAQATPGNREPGIHVYGGKAALCFEADTTRAGEPTVALDAATASAPRKYDWSAKIRVQLTREELPVVTGVLLGLLQRCEFSSHGPNNDKGFSVEHQGDKVFVRIFAKDQGVRAVPVPLAEAFYVAALFVRQLARATGLSVQEIPALLRLTTGRGQ